MQFETASIYNFHLSVYI